MAPAPTPLPPGSLTVPPTFGWQEILTVLVLVIVVAVAFLVIGVVSASVNGRREWQAWLDARPSRHSHPASPPDDRSAGDGFGRR
jgi:hypothetical protein